MLGFYPDFFFTELFGGIGKLSDIFRKTIKVVIDSDYCSNLRVAEIYVMPDLYLYGKNVRK